jgi:protease II
MQHDLTDAVNWAIDQGIADKDNICIYGGSYGGYACLAGEFLRCNRLYVILLTTDNDHSITRCY